MIPKRKKFLILEEQTNLRELLIFTIESSYNFEAVRISSYKESMQIFQDNLESVSFIIVGNSNDKENISKLFSWYNMNGLNDTIPFHSMICQTQTQNYHLTEFRMR